MIRCPLCNNKDAFTPITGPNARAFCLCNQCMLIFTEPHFLPAEQDEKRRYLNHNNGIQHEGYVNFLNQAIEPALPLLHKDMKGLDFGCGPTPTLSVLLEQQSFQCDHYDPFFFPVIPKKEYDFIFATECFEHFFSPAKEIQQIYDLLSPGGFLIIMSEIWKSAETFKTWYYAKDPTHVSYYHEKSLEYIATTFGFKLIKSDGIRVVIFKK